MKVYLTVMLGGCISLLSCKKNYQCDCSHFDSQGYYINTESNNYKERSRDKAQSACIAKSNTTPYDVKKCTIVN